MRQHLKSAIVNARVIFSALIIIFLLTISVTSYSQVKSITIISSGNESKTEHKRNIPAIDTTSYFAIYNYEFLEDSTSINSKTSTIMNLFIGKSLSKFEHSNYYIKDSLYLHSKLTGVAKTQYIIDQTIGNITPTSIAGYKIIKHNNSNITELYDHASGKFYSVKEDIEFNWKITTNKDTLIAGYKAREARCHFRGRQYRAWYAVELPFNDGPYKFKGLPGLIIKLEDVKRTHCFELLSFAKMTYPRPIYLEKTNNITPISAKDYAVVKKAGALYILQLVESGKVTNVSQEELGEAEAKMRRINN